MPSGCIAVPRSVCGRTRPRESTRNCRFAAFLPSTDEQAQMPRPRSVSPRESRQKEESAPLTSRPRESTRHCWEAEPESQPATMTSSPLSNSSSRTSRQRPDTSLTTWAQSPPGTLRGGPVPGVRVGRAGERVAGVLAVAEALGVPEGPRVAVGLGVTVCVAVAVTVTEPAGGRGSAPSSPVGAGSSPVAYTRPVAARPATVTSSRETRGEG